MQTLDAVLKMHDWDRWQKSKKKKSILSAPPLNYSDKYSFKRINEFINPHFSLIIKDLRKDSSTSRRNHDLPVRIEKCFLTVDGSL